VTATARQAPSGPSRRQESSVRRRAQARPTVSLTGRGGIVVVFVAGLAGALLSRWLGVGLLAGFGFVVGCVLAALATRQADLLTLVVSPPLVFFVVTLLAELLSSLTEESLWRAVLVGLVTSLAATAPWLFLGTLLVALITIPRGLPAALRELRTRLAGSRLFEEDDNADPVRWDESPPRPHVD
jgi:uncharacterized protein DUF6542